MSLTPKRATPRWSVGKLTALLPASIAGLFCSKAMVNVEPPLSANGPKRGSMLFKLPTFVKLQLKSELMLFPPSVIVPKALVPEELLATMVFFNVTVPVLVRRFPPKRFPLALPVPPVQPLPNNVALTKSTLTPLLSTAPPPPSPPLPSTPPPVPPVPRSPALPPAQLLLTKVLLTTVNVPASVETPPPDANPPAPPLPALKLKKPLPPLPPRPPVALFPKKVQFVTLTLPALLKMPPPAPALPD